MSGRHKSPKLSGQQLEQLARFSLMVEHHLARVGRAIEIRRLELGLSRPQLARLIPVADKTVERWEKGQSGGADSQLDRVAEVMDTTSADMLAAALAEEREEPGASPLEVFSESDRLARLEAKVDRLLDRLGADEKAEEVERLAGEARAEDQSQGQRQPRTPGAASG